MKMFKNHPSLRAEVLRAAKGKRSKPSLFAEIASSPPLLAMTIKRILRSQAGYALPLALILLLFGGFFVVPCLNLLYTSLNANIMVDERDLELYAADACVEYALWYMQDDVENNGGAGLPAEGQEDTLEDLPDGTINDKTLNVTISNEGEDGYKITSTATSPDGDSTTVVSYVDVISGGASVFDYGIVALGGDGECDINLGGNSDVESDVELEGDIYAVGDICLSGNAEIDGDATATGEISTSGNADVNGEEIEGDTNSPSAPEIGTLVDKAGVQDAACNGVSCGDYTPPSNWTLNEDEDYEDRVHVQGSLNISGICWLTFADTVCVGQDVNISSIAGVTFQGPLKVVGDVNISTLRDVTFGGTVCVGGDLVISGSGDVTFGDMVYVGGDLIITSNADVQLGGTVYVQGNFTNTGNADVKGGETVVVDGNITLTGNSGFNEAAEDIPMFISTAGDVTVTGNSNVAAIIYAPNGDITLSGNSDLYGSAIGLTVTGQGNNDLVYPIGLRDLYGTGGDGGGEGRVEIRTYTIQ